MTTTDTAKPASRHPRKMARKPQADEGEQFPPARLTKSSKVLAMLGRPEGATLDQLVTENSWLPHTARAALTGLRKKGYVITSNKPEGRVRTYRVTTASEAAE